MTQSPRELAAQKVQFQREQERLLQDLLGILDALDHACDHWQQAIVNHRSTPTDASPSMGPMSPRRRTGWIGGLIRRWQTCIRKWFGRPSSGAIAPSTRSDAMGEVLVSAHEGVDMIRRSLLDLLSERQVAPMETLGQPFDPTRMYALGRQEDAEADANTVVQEVVRGYLWKERILREAQVIVASPPVRPD
ncbi:MAG: nucleotide exchange factor GrpE [Thermosynechococcaceae cyanobacterium]